MDRINLKTLWNSELLECFKIHSSGRKCKEMNKCMWAEKSNGWSVMTAVEDHILDV